MKAALTQTVNAFKDMPERVKDLSRLAGRLEEIRAANIEHHAELIESAALQGAEAVCLGELFAAPYFALDKNPMWLGLAEDALEGPSTRELIKIAKTHWIVIVAPIFERDAATGKRYNTAVVIDADGSVRGRYRKSHIPCGVNDQGEFHETFYYGPGDPVKGETHFPVFETQVGRIGVNICYDRHFEGVVAALKAAGAQLIFSPAVTFGEKSRRMWDLEFKVDAARHRVFIGGSNRKGREAPWNQDYFGDSHFCDPDGRRLPDLSENPRVVISELDLGVLSEPDPSGWDLARDRRPDIYRKS